MPEAEPPETWITMSATEVSQPGNTTISWQGTDPWHSTADSDLHYAWRIDSGEWSVFSRETSWTFRELMSGQHVFEVTARDLDFNEDPTPAIAQFVVVPPVWQEPWFIALMVLLLGGVGFQTGRVVRRDRRLKEGNRAMSDANRELFAANQALQRDRAVERIRGEVQTMDEASDFDRVLSLLAEDLETVGLSFDTCGIEVLDVPVEEPTMAYFEEHGYRYTSYTIDPDGAVTSNSYSIPAPFPPVYLEMIERFIAGRSWQGRSEETAILEVPAAGYGRLRITSSDRDHFGDEDIASLADFASAVALGYARYLDIREIQEQTQRKSRFLANMSHELRSPMNAIMGFTNMVLRRSGDALPERQKGNLEKVLEAGDRLLESINGLLDLSKIEAGRMDVEVKRFSVADLVKSCCAEAEPLVAEKAGVDLICDADDGIGEAETDEGRVRQVITNLLSNAVRHTDAGEVAVRARKEDDEIVIAVSDTGAGIPEEALDTIFEEFRQVEGSDAARKGTGLGLPIAQKTTELLGGSTSVASTVGKGSTFTVRLPAIYQKG